MHQVSLTRDNGFISFGYHVLSIIIIFRKIKNFCIQINDHRSISHFMWYFINFFFLYWFNYRRQLEQFNILDGFSLYICVLFAGGCFPHCACAFGNWIPTKSTRCSLTSYPWTTNGTGTRTTSLRGWSRARRTRRHRTGCTRTRILRLRVISCTRRSCRSKKSNSPTTRWTSADRWVRFPWFFFCFSFFVIDHLWYYLWTRGFFHTR